METNTNLRYEISKLIKVINIIHGQSSMTKRDLKLLDQCYEDIEGYLKQMILNDGCDAIQKSIVHSFPT